jgi:putative ABC transport system ATP-binding protein
MKTAISLQGITREFGKGELFVRVLKGVDLEVKQGEFIGLMGKSGAGKSTLLYQMSMLDVPTAGKVELIGVNTVSLSNEERVDFRLEHLGYIFQDYALVPELSAEENVMLPLTMMGYDDETARKMARDTLIHLGLEGKLDNRPNQLSGGQQQRVSIARAVAKNPEILFADEPTANLDSVSSADVIEAMKQLHDDGQTIVMVTHEHEYTKYCTRVLWMEDGVITKELEPFKK